MAEKKKTLTAVTMVVTEPPEDSQEVTVVLAYGTDEDEAKQFNFSDWKSAADLAARYAFEGDIESVDTVFVIGEEQYWFQFTTPEYTKGSRFAPTAMVEVEKVLNRKGFDTRFVGKKRWLIHRPDPSVGYNPKRGYFDPRDTVRLATLDAFGIDAEIVEYLKHSVQSKSAHYLTLGGSTTMAKKAAAAEETKKERLTVKALDGSDVEVSPKQQEIYNEIKKRSASGSPVGSDDERLDDPSSIAAMKLSEVHKAVMRHKFGARWHYFINQKDLDKAVATAEKAAAAAAKAKESSSKKKAASEK